MCYVHACVSSLIVEMPYATAWYVAHMSACCILRRAKPEGQPQKGPRAGPWPSCCPSSHASGNRSFQPSRPLLLHPRVRLRPSSSVGVQLALQVMAATHRSYEQAAVNGKPQSPACGHSLATVTVTITVTGSETRLPACPCKTRGIVGGSMRRGDISTMTQFQLPSQRPQQPTTKARCAVCRCQTPGFSTCRPLLGTRWQIRSWRPHLDACSLHDEPSTRGAARLFWPRLLHVTTPCMHRWLVRLIQRYACQFMKTLNC
jgi:hypothetical protein